MGRGASLSFTTGSRMRRRQPSCQVGTVTGELNPEEQEAMDHLLAFMNTVVRDWELRANADELARGIHQLQGFIVMHMLQREAPDHWGHWYGPRERDG